MFTRRKSILLVDSINHMVTQLQSAEFNLNNLPSYRNQVFENIKNTLTPKLTAFLAKLKAERKITQVVYDSLLQALENFIINFKALDTSEISNESANYFFKFLNAIDTLPLENQHIIECSQLILLFICYIAYAGSNLAWSILMAMYDKDRYMLPLFVTIAEKNQVCLLPKEICQQQQLACLEILGSRYCQSTKTELIAKQLAVIRPVLLIYNSQQLTTTVENIEYYPNKYHDPASSVYSTTVENIESYPNKYHDPASSVYSTTVENIESYPNKYHDPASSVYSTSVWQFILATSDRSQLKAKVVKQLLLISPGKERWLEVICPKSIRDKSLVNDDKSAHAQLYQLFLQADQYTCQTWRPDFFISQYLVKALYWHEGKNSFSYQFSCYLLYQLSRILVSPYQINTIIKQLVELLYRTYLINYCDPIDLVQISSDHYFNGLLRAYINFIVPNIKEQLLIISCTEKNIILNSYARYFLTKIKKDYPINRVEDHLALQYMGGMVLRSQEDKLIEAELGIIFNLLCDLSKINLNPNPNGKLFSMISVKQETIKQLIGLVNSVFDVIEKKSVHSESALDEYNYAAIELFNKWVKYRAAQENECVLIGKNIKKIKANYNRYDMYVQNHPENKPIFHGLKMKIQGKNDYYIPGETRQDIIDERDFLAQQLQEEESKRDMLLNKISRGPHFIYNPILKGSKDDFELVDQLTTIDIGDLLPIKQSMANWFVQYDRILQQLNAHSNEITTQEYALLAELSRAVYRLLPELYILHHLSPTLLAMLTEASVASYPFFANDIDKMKQHQDINAEFLNAEIYMSNQLDTATDTLNNSPVAGIDPDKIDVTLNFFSDIYDLVEQIISSYNESLLSQLDSLISQSYVVRHPLYDPFLTALEPLIKSQLEQNNQTSSTTAMQTVFPQEKWQRLFPGTNNILPERRYLDDLIRQQQSSNGISIATKFQKDEYNGLNFWRGTSSKSSETNSVKSQGLDDRHSESHHSLNDCKLEHRSGSF